MHYLLDSFRRQHQRMFLLHRDTILDADAHAPEMLRPAVGVGDVDASAYMGWISLRGLMLSVKRG